MRALWLALLLLTVPTLAIAAPPVSRHDFQQPLDRSAIRASNAYLQDSTFALKWKDARREGPLMFFRSFPAAFYRDLRSSSVRLPGGKGLVFGDAHPDNFGFLRTGGGRTEYVFNDYDDSGRGPVAADALRYFTALRLAYPDKAKVFERTLDAYVRGVKKPGRVDLPRSLEPNWKELREAELEEFTKGAAFRYGKGTRLSPPSPQVAASVRLLFEKRDARFGVTKVLDVASRERDDGGSGGLERLWVLVDRDGHRDILEMKQTAPAAVDALGARSIPRADRMQVLKTAFQEHPATDDLLYVSVRGTRFEVRDRARMASLSVEDLSKGDRKDVLHAQATILANVHKDSWGDATDHEIHEWLDESSKVLAARWSAAFDRAH